MSILVVQDWVSSGMKTHTTKPPNRLRFCCSVCPVRSKMPDPMWISNGGSGEGSYLVFRGKNHTLQAISKSEDTIKSNVSQEIYLIGRESKYITVLL